ncbi:MAG: hypothetical protein OEU94_16895 [Aquincola sp.]|nr:hypothetical protein [Aquincola sp.]
MDHSDVDSVGVAVMEKLREAQPATLDLVVRAALCKMMTPYPSGAAVRLVTDEPATNSSRPLSRPDPAASAAARK